MATEAEQSQPSPAHAKAESHCREGLGQEPASEIPACQQTPHYPSLCNHTGPRPAVILGQEITPSPPPPSAQGALNLGVCSHSSVALLPA